MTQETTLPALGRKRPMLRWMAQRNTRVVTSQLDTRALDAAKSATSHNWDPSIAVIERFAVAEAALLRHAEVVSRLGDYGWLVVGLVADEHSHSAS